jgi:NAD(P)-dependent dehydrogenase (short-subunit alcohol dehydrogenase family)
MTKTWFITGVSSGFGRALTEALLARGDRVAGTVRKRAVMADLEARYKDRLLVAELDVTNTAAIRAVVGSVFKAFGKVDVVVNNAGYGLAGAAEEVSDDQIRHQIDTNLIGSIQVVRAALPHLRDQRGGKGQLTFRRIHAFDDRRGAVFDQQLCKRAIATTDVDPSQAAPGREPVNESAAGQSTPLAHHPFIDGAVIELDRRCVH